MKKQKREVIGVVGLGYVGLPLATAFATKFKVIGFDIKEARVKELRAGRDSTGEADPAHLKNPRLTFTSDPAALRRCTFIIVAVPTPIDESREPDLTPLESSSTAVGKILKKGMMVVYESTVYPGVTEEYCLPILERESGLKLGQFDLGYSPERVNPGDKQHSVSGIVKVVSGHNARALDRCAAAYGAVIAAGIHKAPNIMTAEAAKVIENVQRDLNIALMNELSKIFARMGLNTNEVLAASATKWNFHRYHPGLVGGHCIGVDPYYLTHRALQLGYHPEVILAGRRINDGMGDYVGELTIRELVHAGVLPRKARIWVLGMTFKENVPDFRNTRAVDVVAYLKKYGAQVYAWEPLVSAGQIKKEFGVDTLTFDRARNLDAVVLINAHDAFKSIALPALRKKMRTRVIVDVKNFFPRERARKLGFHYVSL
ncbi:MAG: nucleotide sugar dehydrogenase [Kiritimatiellae bacterium]|nr:nucleotide sugar dehydrogenase [Kiritimatiellia bacterium]